MAFNCLRYLRGAAVIALTWGCIAGAAHAHGDLAPGADLQSHLGDYEQEIASMNDTVDGIVRDYAAGDPVADRVAALVETWEHVGFHEAVETHAMPLYPAIWTALGGLSAAVDESGRTAEARNWQARVDRALHEGLGALKLAATQTSDAVIARAGESGHTGGTTSADSKRPDVAVIRENLETVVERYRQGEAQAAKTLLHQTYMQRFEGIEGDLIEQDADLVTDLEKDFNATLPLLMEKKASAEELAAHVETMNARLDRAQTLLNESASNQSSVF